jgi:uncharacterized integral membrane protein
LLYWLIGLPVFLVVVVFAINNYTIVDLNLWPLLPVSVPFPIYGVALIAVFAGFIVGSLVGWLQAGRSRQRVRELVRRAEGDRRTIAELEEKIRSLDAVRPDAHALPPVPPVAAAQAPTSSAA